MRPLLFIPGWSVQTALSQHLFSREKKKVASRQHVSRQPIQEKNSDARHVDGSDKRAAAEQTSYLLEGVQHAHLRNFGFGNFVSHV